MAIKFTCGGCGKQYQAPSKLAGRMVRCKYCWDWISVPAFVSSSSKSSAMENDQAGNPCWIFLLLGVLALVALVPTIAFGPTNPLYYMARWMLAFIVLVATAFPSVLSRLGFLSMGRWLILAGLSFVISVGCGILVGILLVLAASSVANQAGGQPQIESYTTGALLTFLFIFIGSASMLATFGCVIAAVVYPKGGS